MEIRAHEALDACIDRFNAGDDRARDELLQLAAERLEQLARKIKRGFPGVGRWEQTEDVCQIASFKLYEALLHGRLEDSRHFYRLAAKKLRETLIDLARHYQGPLGLAAHHRTAAAADPDQRVPQAAYDPGDVTADPQRLAQWGELHAAIEGLPDESREMFDLLWYHELSQEQASELVGVGVRQIKRRWREAKLQLAASLGESTRVFL